MQFDKEVFKKKIHSFIEEKYSEHLCNLKSENGVALIKFIG